MKTSSTLNDVSGRDRVRRDTAAHEGDDYFRRLIERLPAAVYTCDVSGRVTFFNQAAVTLWGRVPKLGTDLWCGSWRIYRRDGTPLPLEKCPLAIALAEGRAVHEEELIIECPDGTRRTVLAHSEPLRDDDLIIVGAVNMLLDVTECKRVENARRESEERFRTLANHAPVGIFMTAPDGGNVFVNEAWCAMAGLTPEQVLGDGWIQAVHPEDRERVVTVWHAAARNGQESVDEFRFLRPDGVITWLQGKAIPIGIPSGEVVGYIGTVADITERISAEQALKEADQRKDEFLAILAHELRNPLAPIRTGLELMRLASDDPALVEEVRATMDRQAQHMARLIDDLLDVSRITRGVVELRRSRIELSSIVRSAVEAARPIIDDYGHELSIAMPKCPIILDADPTRLAQVISNLLNNASKYMQPGGRIELSAERDECEAVVRVKDWGIGIPAEMHDRIFSMFTQLDRALDRSHGGLGIGLTLVKRLVEMHGGTVAVFSAGPGRGSEFTVRMPLVAGPMMVHTTADDGHEAASGRRRILVVDDNESAAKVLAMFLKTLGNEVRTAHDGLAALQVAAAFRPDIILLDLGMPKLDGYEAARRIRREPWGKHTVLAALTGWGQEDDRLRTRTAGFDHHFVKPVDPAVLRRLLAEVPTSSG